MAAPNVTAIAAWIATTGQNADSSIRGSSPTPVDTIPGTPYWVVGPAGSGGRISVLHGSWERVHIPFRCRLYVARTADAARTQATLNGLIGNLIAAFRLGGTESGTVASSLLDEIETGLYEELGSERYEIVDCTVSVVVNDATGYTP